MPVKFLPFLKKGKPSIYELAITQDGLSLEGSEKLGAHIEDILHYVEKKSGDLELDPERIEIFIKSGSRVIGIKRTDDLGVAVVTSSLEEAVKALKDVDKRTSELLRDQYSETFDEYIRDQEKKKRALEELT